MATPQVNESVIRKMTRLALEHSAVNLSQGFPNECPPKPLRLALAHAVLAGEPLVMGDTESADDPHYTSLLRQLSSMSSSVSDGHGHDHDDTDDNNRTDTLNQYSPPMGRGDVRDAIASYYRRLYNYEVDPDNITVTLGATEALACALRTLGRPADKVVIMEPFHELYPSQCHLFYLEPVYVTLRPLHNHTAWSLDFQELENALRNARILVLNTPHNPTGKVFHKDELARIVELCLQYNVFIVTDEIYEHMCYQEDQQHVLIPQQFPQAAHLCFVCNSMGKSASATGWRLGWCLHPPEFSTTYRGIHDQLAVMAPHPMQYSSIFYFRHLSDNYFRHNVKERYRQRVQLLGQTLQELRFTVIPPEGAYYLFVNFDHVPALARFVGKPMEAAMFLMKEVGVACVPGDNFYGKAIQEQGGHYLRFAACRSDQDIQEACRRLKEKLLLP